MKKRPALLSAIGLTFVLLAILGISLTAQAAPVTAVPQAPNDNTYQAPPFSQAWTITTMITTNDNWSGVPGIVGYLGDFFPSSTTAIPDPRTIVSDTTGVAIDVIANQTNPNTLTSGGVAEFDTLADPVVALQGSGTADAPFILLHLNTTGLANVTISYNLRDIDGSADNAVQAVALQYRVGSTGIFTNVPAGFVADATTGPSLATLVTPVTATLPSETNDQSQVQVRIITSNASGNDEWVGIDDISVTGTPLVEQSDLDVAKSGPLTASAGDPINYTISISNSGTTTATSTIVTDTLPAEVTFVTYTTALPVSFSRDAQALVWNLGDIANGASGSITVQGVISSGLSNGTVFTNFVSASTTTTETTTANNTATATTLIGAPDLVLVKTGPASAASGDQVAYTLSYSNTGDLNATGVVLVDQLPVGLTYVGDSLGGVQVGSRITWTLGTVPVSATGSVVLTAAAVYVGDQVNVATISGSPTDSNPLDNVSVFTTTVQGSDPFVIKTGPSVVFGGEPISYTIVYGNHGSASVDVTLTDTLPISFTTYDIAFDDGPPNPIDNANTRSWTRTLAAGDRFTITLALTVPTAIASNTRITNTIEITAASLGNNPIDDLSSASSTVYQIVPISIARAGVNGQVFAVEGQVIVVPATYSAGEWELQDGSGAITAFYTPAPTIALGDRVRLVGVFDNSFGAQPELTSPRYFANLGPGSLVNPIPHQTGDIPAGTASGWLVTISGTLSSLTDCSGNYHLAVNDGSGAADVFINAFSNPAINPCGRGFANSDWVQVTGFSTVFSPTYEVRPRMANDLVQYPRVLSVSPANGAIEVPLAATLTATFNTTMTNVSGATFLLQGPGGAVAGSVDYNPATKTAVFTPTAALTANTLYTATLKAALMADNGLTLMPAQDYVWTFTAHRPTADLSTSTKGNSVNGAVHAGQWVTYTITLNNTGDGDATAVVTDVLGSYYTVAKVLDFTQPTTGTLTWTGVVTAGQSVNLQFVAQVKGPQYLPLGGSLLLNSAQVSDGIHSPVTVDDPMPPTITIYGVYLPIIKR